MGEKIRDINSAGNAGNRASPRELAPWRLATIVAGDIAGLNRLLDLDEAGTHSRVKSIESDVIEPRIAEHYGRLLKATGDGFIATFDSPLEAVQCSIGIQQSLSSWNISLAADQRIEYRIGINLSEVIIDDRDTYGEGVSVEYCLESIADPGEVYVSGDIYEQIKHKLACRYELLGDRKVRNIADPAKVYRVLPATPTLFSKASRPREIAKIVLQSCLISFVLLAIVGSLISYTRQRPDQAAKGQDHTTTAALAQAVHSLSSRLAVGSQSPSPSQPVQSSQQSKAPSTEAAAPNAQPAAPPAPATDQATLQTAPASQAAPAAAATKQAALEGAPQQAAPAIAEPEMSRLKGGAFMMGSNDDFSEKPVHQVTLKPFAISRYPISVREWNVCATAKACAFVAGGRDDTPVTNVSWGDAKQFVAWLAETTHKPYRLPSEAEWEYAARAGTQTKYWWGDEFQPGRANCKNCTDIAAADQPAKLGSFKPNPFGLYDMGGGVDQWVEDCWHKNYHGASPDGSPWVENDCVSHVIRSGSWKNDPHYVRPSNRDSYDTNVRYPTHGFRVALSP